MTEPAGVWKVLEEAIVAVHAYPWGPGPEGATLLRNLREAWAAVELHRTATALAMALEATGQTVPSTPLATLIGSCSPSCPFYCSCPDCGEQMCSLGWARAKARAEQQHQFPDPPCPCYKPPLGLIPPSKVKV